MQIPGIWAEWFVYTIHLEICSDLHQICWAWLDQLSFGTQKSYHLKYQYFDTKCWIFTKRQLGIFVKKTWFFRKCCFSERKTCSLLKRLVFKRKSWLSAFQNTKKLWNRCIITDFRWNWKWCSLFLHVHAYVAVHPSNTVNMYLIYACTCKKREHHFQFHLKSVIMHRFQSFLVFCKAESQLFHLKISRFKR